MTPIDTSDPDDDHLARIMQCVSIYKSAGFEIDLLFCGPSAVASPGIEDLLSISQQIAILPDVGACGEAVNHDKLHPSIAQLTVTVGTYDVIHADQILVPRRSDLGRIWIADCHVKKPVLEWACDQVDMAIASLASALPSWKAPFELVIPVDSHKRDARALGTMIGWCGPWPEGAAQAWSDILHAIAERGQKLERAFLFAGLGTAELDVPPVIARWVVHQERCSSGAERALSLAVLPIDQGLASLAKTARLAAQGVPTILTPCLAENYDGLWQVPTATGRWECADMIQAWSDPGHRASVSRALAATVSALHKRSQAKTAEFIEAVNQRV